MVSSNEKVIVAAEISLSVLENKAREKQQKKTLGEAIVVKKVSRWCVQYLLLQEMKLEFTPIKCFRRSSSCHCSLNL